MDQIEQETEELLKKIDDNRDYVITSNDEIRFDLINIIKQSLPIYYNDNYLIEFVRYRIIEAKYGDLEVEVIQHIFKFEGCPEVYGSSLIFNGSDDIGGDKFTKILNEERARYLTQYLNKTLKINKEGKEEKKIKI